MLSPSLAPLSTSIRRPGARTTACAGWRRLLREAGYEVVEQVGRRPAAQHLRGAWQSGRGSLDASRLRAAVFREPGRGRLAVRPRSLRREGHRRLAGGGGGNAAPARASPTSACCSSSAKSGEAMARRAAQGLASGSKFLINGEPTDNRLGIATRGALRYHLRAKGRAAHSSFPELGESAIEKLLDALIMLRRMEFPEDPVLGTDPLHCRPHQRRRGAERHPGGGRSRDHVPDRRGRARHSRVDDPTDAARDAGRDSRRAPRDAADHPGVRDRDVSVHDRHPVSLRHGAHRCSMARARSTSPTQTTST